MLYFAEIKNKPVFTENRDYIGRLLDLNFKASETPFITKILVRDQNKKLLFIPVEFLRRFNGRIVVSNNYKTEEYNPSEFSINRNFLDRQIIDIKGHKIVRVNDVLIEDKNKFFVAGFDTSFLAVLRWFNLEHLSLKFFNFFRLKIEPKILPFTEIQPLDINKNTIILNRETERLEKIHPADLADYLEKTNISNIHKILNLLDEDFAAEVIGNLNINYQTSLFRRLKEERAAKIVTLIDPDVAVDILLTLSRRRRDLIISFLPQEKKTEITYLLTLSKTTIGGELTSEFLTVSPGDTVRKIIDKIKKEAADFFYLSYIYVLNNDDQLIGVFNLHELLIQGLDTQVYKFMVQNVITINLSTPEEIALKKMLKYRINALPVVDRHKHMLGIVTIDNVAEFACRILS